MKLRFIITILWVWTIATGNTVFAQSNTLFGGQGATSIDIDIKPGDDDNIVRASANRIIRVALFASENLDINTINPRTIRLNGVDVLLVGKSDKSLCKQTDMNGDDLLDLLCDVRTTGFRVGEGEYRIIIKASSYTGESFQGEDRIRIVLN